MRSRIAQIIAPIPRWLLLGAALPLTLSAQHAPGETLAPELTSRSPFLPPDLPPPSTRPAPEEVSALDGAYEFRGYYAVNGDVRVVIKEPRSPNGTWLSLNETRDGITLVSFDPRARRIVLESAGDTVRLELVTLTGNSDPIPVSGQPSVEAARRAAQVAGGAVAGGGNETASVRRRVIPPRPPKWIQDRMRAQGIDPDAGFGEPGAGPSSGPPTEVPPPPPNIEVPELPAGLANGPPPELPPEIAATVNREFHETESNNPSGVDLPPMPTGLPPGLDGGAPPPPPGGW